jgi:hypothetical protein
MEGNLAPRGRSRKGGDPSPPTGEAWWRDNGERENRDMPKAL